MKTSKEKTLQEFLESFLEKSCCKTCEFLMAIKIEGELEGKYSYRLICRASPIDLGILKFKRIIDCNTYKQSKAALEEELSKNPLQSYYCGYCGKGEKGTTTRLPGHWEMVEKIGDIGFIFCSKRCIEEAMKAHQKEAKEST